MLELNTAQRLLKRAELIQSVVEASATTDVRRQIRQDTELPDGITTWSNSRECHWSQVLEAALDLVGLPYSPSLEIPFGEIVEPFAQIVSSGCNRRSAFQHASVCGV